MAKLVEVERVKVLPPKSSATRSMILVKVKAGNKRPELLQLAEVFRAHAVDVTGESLIFVATGDEGKLRAFVDVMRPYGVTEMVQTGLVALERGDTSLAVEKSRFEWPPLDDGHAGNIRDRFAEGSERMQLSGARDYVQNTGRRRGNNGFRISRGCDSPFL